MGRLRAAAGALLSGPGALPRSVDVLVVGAGQAGLGVAQRLQRHSALRAVVVDALPVGETWRERWDSLQLFTPRRFSALPGSRFPRGPSRSPSRTEMADYLQAYARDHALPVRTGVRVHRLSRTTTGFLAEIETGTGTTGEVVAATQVVLATGPFRRPFVPGAGQGLDPAVPQLHSFHYRSPADVPPGEVLVVGGGNSAAQLALELAATHRVTVAAPRPLWFLPEDVAGVSMYWWTLLTGVLNARADAWVSRLIRRRGDAVVGTALRDRVEAGEVRVLASRVVDGQGRAVTLQDGTVVPVTSVLWCTGFRPDTDWIDVPGALADDGSPLHDQGASPVPGLHWMGLPWQTRLNSSIIDGVDRDARRTVRRLVERFPGRASTP